MEGNTITFRELVKLIHPDSNPHITDASGKMVLAVQNKNNPTELYKLAVRWGLRHLAGARPQSTPRPQPRQETPRPRYEAPREPVFVWVADLTATPVVGDFVCVVTKAFMRVEVVRVTPKRVYFFDTLTQKRTFADKNNVYVVRRVQKV